MSIKVEVRPLDEVMIGEIAEPADWLVASLATGISWPVSYEKYEYQGKSYYILPLAEGHHPAVAFRKEGLDLAEAKTTLMRFLSAMCWAANGGAVVVSFFTGRIPQPLPRSPLNGMIITGDMNLWCLPVPETDEQRLALALMREGRGLNHPAYAFLSFYRILEVAVPSNKRGDWISESLELLDEHREREALEKLRETGVEDVGRHIQKARRQAIAHANSQPIIDPDDASHHDDLLRELPVMRGLARHAIETVLGIKTRSTIYREHLYELSGFKDHFGNERVARIQAGDEPAEGEQIDLPVINVRLRKCATFSCLEGMQPLAASQQGAIVTLRYQSQDGLVVLTFRLDFAEERLLFEWNEDLEGHDDGTSKAATYAAEIHRFILEYVGNGELHIFNYETGAALSRKDAFIPVNYWANHDGLKTKIAEWEVEAERRAKAEAAP